MKRLLFVSAFAFFTSCGTSESGHRTSQMLWSRGHQDRYPRTPDVKITPGTLCQRADSFRYPEHIKYCERDVETRDKRRIFEHYDRVLGYQTQQLPRLDFKIDHLIPLCMGGSNDDANLWPQHKSIYKLTDPVEPIICDMMKAGKMKQADAVRIVLDMKQDPDSAPQVQARLLKGRY